MLTYTDILQYFGIYLFDKDFQSFLSTNFKDLSEYNILEGDYLISEATGIELGFTNNEAVYDDDTQEVFEIGRPIFSHFNIYPKSDVVVKELPFNVRFVDNRSSVISKAGQPTQTNQGYAKLLDQHFLVDNYKVNGIVITFDYNPKQQKINFIQIRDNNLRENIKL